MSTPNRVVVAGILLTAVTLLTISSWTLQRQIHEFDALSLRAGSRSSSTSSTAPDASREMIYIPDLGTVPDPVVTPPTPTAERASTLAKLQRKPGMRFAKETPLQDVLDYVKTATRDAKDDHDLQIYIDPIDLQEVDKTLASPVTIDLVGLPLSTTLGLVLKQLGLIYRVDNDGLIQVFSARSDDAPIDPDRAIAAQLYHLRCEVAALRGELAAYRSGVEVKTVDLKNGPPLQLSPNPGGFGGGMSFR